MNVTCPHCTTVFRVDPAKVPEGGVRARCSVCSGLIEVQRPEQAAIVAPTREPATPTAPAPPPPAARPAQPASASQPVAKAVEPAPPPPPATRPPEPAGASEPAPPPPPPSSPPPVPFSALPGGAMEVEPEPPSRPARSAAPAQQASSGYTNPFLQQDPTTRARRLARALVSDLVVYHPDKRQRGLAEGNLKELFGEEIRKSWEEYTEQVGEEVARSTPYFTEALNEILAEGRDLFG